MITYDPPSGWRYGFPRTYLPATPDEPLVETLVRDGYPAAHAETAAKHCRFIGSFEELNALEGKAI